MLDFNEYAKIYISLFAIMDPVGIIPIIIAFTIGLEQQRRKHLARMASISVFGILLLALLVGELILQFFGISIHSFRAAGGILLLMMSLGMLTNQKHVVNESSDDATSSLAIVPLSTPLLAGPGAITTVIIDAHKGTSYLHYALMAVVLLLLSVTVWLTFLAAPWVEKRMGRTGIHIFTRLMGLVLASIAVEFIAGGIKGLFPKLG
jgi:multiple antibiotic resistance protein